MTYYYNNQKVRTSKTMEYNYAIVYFDDNGKLICQNCSKTYEGAMKPFQNLVDVNNRGLKNVTEMLASRKWWSHLVDNANYYIEHGEAITVDEYCEKWAIEELNFLEKRKAVFDKCKLVRLEAREK